MAAARACPLVAFLLLGLALARRDEDQEHAVLKTEHAGFGAFQSGLKVADLFASSTNLSKANAILAGIAQLGADVASHAKWVFYYMEWCPNAQLIFKELRKHGMLDAFRKRATMRCVSSFEDFITSHTKQGATVQQVATFIAKGNFADPNEGLSAENEIKCDSAASTHQSMVWEEMERAWDSGHDISCTKTFNNNKHTSPALVIGNTMYCQARELRSWLVAGVGSTALEQQISTESSMKGSALGARVLPQSLIAALTMAAMIAP